MVNTRALHKMWCSRCENVTHLPSVGQVFVRGFHLFEASAAAAASFRTCHPEMNIFSWHFEFYPGRLAITISFSLSLLLTLNNNVLTAQWLKRMHTFDYFISF